MNYLLVFCFIAAFIAPFVYIFYSSGKLEKKLIKRIAQATPVKAKIIKIDNATLDKPFSGYTDVRLTLETQLTNNKPYQVSACWSVKHISIPNIQPGMFVDIKIDQENKELVYPNVDWAIYRMS